MRVASKEAGVKQAAASAKYFQAPFVVFADTSGNWRCEREESGPKEVLRDRVDPDGTVTELEPEYRTPRRLAEAGLSMAALGPLVTAHLPVLKALGTEVLKAKDIYHVVSLLEECLGAKAGSHVADLLEARIHKEVRSAHESPV